MRLLAISDLHLGHPVNREFFPTIGRFPDDCLILAGDVGETEAHLTLAFQDLTERFARVIWVPGNHELWTTSLSPGAAAESPDTTRWSNWREASAWSHLRIRTFSGPEATDPATSFRCSRCTIIRSGLITSGRPGAVLGKGGWHCL
jgi:hypothetical protein